VFLGYPSSHRGYRCLDLSTRRIITLRHVVFDEFTFPFAQENPCLADDSLDFLLELAAIDPPPISAAHTHIPRASSSVSACMPGSTTCTPSSPACMHAPAPPSPPAHAHPTPTGNSPSPLASPSSSGQLAGNSSPDTSAPTPPPLLDVPATNSHTMITRAKHGIHKPPRERLNLSTIESTISPVSKTYWSTLHDPH
jgi:histone deacetylase 1/2